MGASKREELVGKRFINEGGFGYKVKDYFNYNNMTIEFDDGEIVTNRKYDKVVSGKVRHPKQERSNLGVEDGNRNIQKSFLKAREELLNKVKVNEDGQKYTITEYYNSQDITIVFEDGTKLEHITSKNIRNGKITNPYFPTLCHFGFLGIGIYKTKIDGKVTPEYSRYSDMVRRCYQPEKLKKDPSYIGCSVCDEWRNFQKFGEFYTQNYYEVEGEKMELDKDLLVPNNRVYSPTTAIFIPQHINKILVRNRDREALMTDEEFTIYKNEREQKIRGMAEVYKGKVTEKVYQALLNYKLEK